MELEKVFESSNPFFKTIILEFIAPSSPVKSLIIFLQLYACACVPTLIKLLKLIPLISKLCFRWSLIHFNDFLILKIVFRW